MADPLILWSETLRFLELLGRSPDSVDALLFPPKEGPGSDKGAKKARLDEAGRQGVEMLLGTPIYRRHSLGIRPNPGGSLAKEITEGRALFFEADGGLPIEAQEALPELLGLPEPTVTVWTGGKSLHAYWAAPEGEELTVEEWREAQARLIAAVKEVSPEAGVDEAIKDPSRVMRCPGSIHPATGERCRIHSASEKRYNLADLVERLPALPEKKEVSSIPLREKAETLSPFPPRSLEEIEKAAAFIPERVVGGNTYETCRHALCGCAAALAEIDLPEEMALDLLAEKWPDRKSAQSVLESSTTRAAGSFWAIAKEHGYQAPATEAPQLRYTAASASSASSASAPVHGRRRLSTQERLDLLRETTEELLSEGAAPLDRLPVLRERASELELRMTDRELQRIVWEARRKNAPPAEALKPGDLLDFTPVPWCWEGLIMRKATSLVIAAPKVGKTSLVLEAIASWSRGEPFLGRSFHGECPPVLIVGSDQPQSDWGRMLQKVGLVSEERRLLAPIVGLFHSGAPLSLDPEGIEKITTYAKNHPDLFVVIDSYSRCVASLGVSERDAEIAGPLADLQEALGPYGASIVVIHHSNKGSHESGSMASRGSTALPAACSQILHLQRLEPSEGGQQGSLSGKRMLSTEGRGGAPEKLLLELDPEGRWLFKGDGDALLQEQERQKAISSLSERQAIALDHLEEVWLQTEGRQGISADLLASLMELQGASPTRAARHLLEQLRERGLARKVIQSEGKSQGTLARYVPTAQEELSPRTPQTPKEGSRFGSNLETLSPRTPQTPIRRAEADEADEADEAGKREEGASALELSSVDLFESVEVFLADRWANGWMVLCGHGELLELCRLDDSDETIRLPRDRVRSCRS